MGFWEEDNSLRCVDCGAVIPEPKLTNKGSVRRHFYRIQRGEGMIILCPACWTTARIHPVLKRSA